MATNLSRCLTWLILIVLASCGTGGTSVVELVPLAKRELVGLNAKTIEDLIALREDQIDIGTAALVIAHELNPDVEVETNMAIVEQLAIDLWVRLGGVVDDEQQAVHLLRFLFHERGYGYVDYPNGARGVVLDNVLKEGRGNCVGLSTLYLAVGERTGLDLAAVVWPAHMFVRLRGSDGWVALEPTAGGLHEGDGPEDHWFDTERQREREWCSSPLTRREMVGFMIGEIATPVAAMGRSQRGQELGAYALELAPRLPVLWAQQATLLANLEFFDQARDAAQACLAVDPDFSGAWEVLGQIEGAVKDWPKSIEAIEKAIAIAPDFPPSYLMLANALRENGDFERALEVYYRARSLQWTQLHRVRRRMLEHGFPSREDFDVAVLHGVSEVHLALGSAPALAGAAQVVAGREGRQAPGPRITQEQRKRDRRTTYRHLNICWVAMGLVALLNGDPLDAGIAERLAGVRRDETMLQDEECGPLLAELESLLSGLGTGSLEVPRTK